MKRLLISMILAGTVTVLAGCCNTGGCGAYTNTYATYTVPVVSTCSTCNVRPVSVCSTCGVSNACSTCGYGFGYNDWY